MPLIRHFELVTQFETKVAENPELKKKTSTEKWLAMNDQQKIITLQMAMKVCGCGCGCGWRSGSFWFRRAGVNYPPLELSNTWFDTFRAGE
jgi:hypothetical protein